MISAEEIKALMANFEACKIDYAKPYNDVDSGELFNHAWKMSEALTTLQTLLNQAAEALEYQEKSINDYERESGNLIKGVTRHFAQQALAAIQPYLTKEQPHAE